LKNKILIYYPSNKRSNVIETLATEFAARGNEVFLLTHDAQGDLHNILKERKISTFGQGLEKKHSALFYIKGFYHLIRFCRKHKITAVQSHLQQANLIAVFAQYFIRARVVVYRHHLSESNSVSQTFDHLINSLAKWIVVPSKIIRDKAVLDEKTKPEKVFLYPYVYDFDLFAYSPQKAEQIRQQYNCRMLLMICGRFVPIKRNEIAIQAAIHLLELNYDVKLIALDTGPGLKDCVETVEKAGLSNKIFFPGYQSNVMDYIAASDVLIHPSVSEASNNTVKEAAILSKNVIACDGVGDFPDYMVNGENGFLVNKNEPLSGIIDSLLLIYENPSDKTRGEKLKEAVYKRFNKSNETIDQHLKILL
jgi:glycosyltransferase involved in cell wall biosynthesis